MEILNISQLIIAAIMAIISFFIYKTNVQMKEINNKLYDIQEKEQRTGKHIRVEKLLSIMDEIINQFTNDEKSLDNLINLPKEIPLSNFELDKYFDVYEYEILYDFWSEFDSLYKEIFQSDFDSRYADIANFSMIMSQKKDKVDNLKGIRDNFENTIKQL